MGDFLSLSGACTHRATTGMSKESLHKDSSGEGLFDKAISAANKSLGLSALRDESKEAVTSFKKDFGLDGYCSGSDAFICNPIVGRTSIADLAEGYAIAQVNIVKTLPYAAAAALTVYTGGAVLEAVPAVVVAGSTLAGLVMSGCALFQTHGVELDRGTHEAHAVGGRLTIFSEADEICRICSKESSFCGQSEAFEWIQYQGFIDEEACEEDSTYCLSSNDLEIEMKMQAVLDAATRVKMNGERDYIMNPIDYLEELAEEGESAFIRWYHDENSASEPEYEDTRFRIIVGFSADQMEDFIETDSGNDLEDESSDMIKHIPWNVDLCEEPEPEDRDGDGIIDDEDACPTRPGVEQRDPDLNGCERDRDGDGIFDAPKAVAEDKCPTKAGPRDSSAGVGCPEPPPPEEPEPEPETQPPLELSGVSFKPGKYGMNEMVNDRAADGIHSNIALGSAIYQLQQRLAQEPDAQFGVIGYTSSEGSHASNQTLSENRAKTIRDYFVTNGIAASHFVDPIGCGESCLSICPEMPLPATGTQQQRNAQRDLNRAQNRRLQVVQITDDNRAEDFCSLSECREIRTDTGTASNSSDAAMCVNPRAL